VWKVRFVFTDSCSLQACYWYSIPRPCRADALPYTWSQRASGPRSYWIQICVWLCFLTRGAFQEISCCFQSAQLLYTESDLSCIGLTTGATAMRGVTASTTSAAITPPAIAPAFELEDAAGELLLVCAVCMMHMKARLMGWTWSV
jgi:hypothetical protein